MIRLNKYLAEQGYASRRGADTLIEEGAVLVNDSPAVMGQKVDPDTDTITVNKNVLEQKEQEKRYFILNKPVGYVCATKKTMQDPKIILDLFPLDENNFPRIYPVGRLDKDSCGLILLTNDGDLTYRLMHPSFEHEKEYHVELFNFVSDEMVQKLSKPFFMLGQKTRPAEVQKIDHKKISIILREGKNRQIRRMIRSVGSGVDVLKRVRIENLFLPKNLTPGKWKEIPKSDIQKYFGKDLKN